MAMFANNQESINQSIPNSWDKSSLYSDHKNADFLYKNSDNRILQEFLQDVKMETSNLIVLHTRDMPVNCHLIFI